MSSIKTVPETLLRVSSGNDPTSTLLEGAVGGTVGGAVCMWGGGGGGRQLLMIRK